MVLPVHRICTLLGTDSGTVGQRTGVRHYVLELKRQCPFASNVIFSCQHFAQHPLHCCTSQAYRGNSTFVMNLP